MTPELHVLGVDPGGGTGWCRLTVPRLAIFGREKPEILEWDHGLLAGDENDQAIALSRIAREVQSLTYKVGPAIVCEAWDQDPRFKSTDPEALSPVRIGAKLSLLQRQGQLGDSTLTFQGRTIAKTTYTDERLKVLGLYVPQKDTRDSVRHALTLVRRARQSRDLAATLWPYAARGI